MVVDILLLQTVSILVTSAGLLLAALYYVLQIRHQTRIRKTDLIIRLYSKLANPEFNNAMRTFMSLEFKDNDEFVKKYGAAYSKTSVESRQAAVEVGNFFELIGTLLFRGYIDLQLIYDVFGVSVIKEVYEKSFPLIMGKRKETNELIQGSGFVFLYNELIRKEPQLKKTWKKASLQPVIDPRLHNELQGDISG